MTNFFESILKVSFLPSQHRRVFSLNDFFSIFFFQQQLKCSITTQHLQSCRAASHLFHPSLTDGLHNVYCIPSVYWPHINTMVARLPNQALSFKYSSFIETNSCVECVFLVDISTATYLHTYGCSAVPCPDTEPPGECNIVLENGRNARIRCTASLAREKKKKTDVLWCVSYGSRPVICTLSRSTKR